MTSHDISPGQSPIGESDARRQESLKNAFGPILQYLNDDAITDIILNDDGVVRIEKAGGKGLQRTPTCMSPADTLRALRLIAVAMGTELNSKQPSLAGKLPIWGARVQAAIPPIVPGPIFAIRKPAKVIFTLDQYVERRILTEEQAAALRAAVLQRKTILVGGGTGSGKTTLLNALLDVLSKTNDRLLILEDNLELQCAAEDKQCFLVQPPVYTFQHAVLDAMRLRPDRIFIGELRDGPSTLEWVKAANTGHPGGMSSVHANDTRSVLDRICQLIQEVVPRAPRLLVAQTINISLHIQRDSGHPAGRSITGIARVHGWTKKNGWDLTPLTGS